MDLDGIRIREARGSFASSFGRYGGSKEGGFPLSM